MRLVSCLLFIALLFLSYSGTASGAVNIRANFLVVGQTHGINLASPVIGNITVNDADVCSFLTSVNSLAISIPFAFSYNGFVVDVPLSGPIPNVGVTMLARIPVNIQTVSGTNSALRTSLAGHAQFLVNFSITIIALPGFSYDIAFSDPLTHTVLASSSGFGIYSLTAAYDPDATCRGTTTTTRPTTTTTTTIPNMPITTPWPNVPNPPLIIPPIDTLDLSPSNAVRPSLVWTYVQGILATVF